MGVGGKTPFTLERYNMAKFPFLEPKKAGAAKLPKSAGRAMAPKSAAKAGAAKKTAPKKPSNFKDVY